MKTLAECLLYGIVDLGYVAPEKIEHAAVQMCLGGVDILQLRAKNFSLEDAEEFGLRLAPICETHRIPLIINDHPEIVPTIGAAGAHVGQEDRPVSDARWRAGRALAGEVPPAIIGKSTHGFAQAVAAAEEGADYIGFGPLYPTPTKAGRTAIGLADIRRVHEAMRIPIFCIGGINRETLDAVLAAGARRVVIVSGILRAPDIAAYCRDVKARLQA